jgi:hypothetical protein
MVTVASGTMAPVESVTVPVMVAVVESCAKRGWWRTGAQRKRTRMRKSWSGGAVRGYDLEKRMGVSIWTSLEPRFTGFVMGVSMGE